MKWESKYLHEIATTSSGGTPSRTVEKYWNGNIPWIKSGQLKDGYITDCDEFITEDGMKNSSANLVLPGTLLLALYGATAGKLAFTSIEATTNQAVCAISTNDKLVNNKYLFYFLLSKRAQILNDAAGGAQPNISQGYVKNIKVPLPPLHIQEQIADTLDKADALRRKDHELLQKYDELAQAIFYDMFGDPVRNERGWKYLTLEQISLVKGQYGSGASAIEYDPKKYRYVRITDISENGKLNNKPVSASGNNSDYELQNGDLLFARTGATVGKTYLYKDEDGPCIYAGYLIRFRINREFAVPDYVFHFCKTKYYKNWVAAKQNVVAQPNINAQQYGKELLIPIPPINLQERFLKLLTKNEKSSDLCSSGFNKTECLFSTLLQTNFS